MRKCTNVTPRRYMPFPTGTPSDINRACQSLREAYYRLRGRKRVSAEVARAIRSAQALARMGRCEDATDLLWDEVEKLTATLATGRQS